MKTYEELYCIVCGNLCIDNGMFCSEECRDEYDYINRTCDTCGGEFWDGGMTCTCEEWND